MIGQVYGSYRLTRSIGEGGVGAVYEAEHIEFGRKAAVKVLLPTWSRNEVVVKRFMNEARASAMANHPGIVEVFDCNKAENGRAYLVMELLDGEPLSKTLERESTLPIRRMTSIARQIASALAAAHAKGVIHRDLKPDNIFLIPDGNAQTGERIKNSRLRRGQADVQAAPQHVRRRHAGNPSLHVAGAMHLVARGRRAERCLLPRVHHVRDGLPAGRHSFTARLRPWR